VDVVLVVVVWFIKTIGKHSVVVGQAASKAKTFTERVLSGIVVIVIPEGPNALTSTSVYPDKSVHVVQSAPVQV
jgi:hypothetical protein